MSTDEHSLREELGHWPEGSRVIVEATPLAEWLAPVVEGCGHEVVIIDARAARNLVRSKKKTDARDAYTLARVGRVAGTWRCIASRRRRGCDEASCRGVRGWCVRPRR